MAEKQIGQELHILHNLTKRCIDNSPNKKKIDNVTGTNGWIIAYLTDHLEQDIYQKDLEKDFGITRSTASKVINLMIQKGLVEHQAVPHDARLKKLVLTEKSLELAQLMKMDHQMIEARLARGFSEKELDTLFSYLERLRSNLTSEE